ncbi:hypothetical protein Lfu02_13250 [Longispora fulva]|uniref:8-amino-7-oxononanoate synthase n=1 Tax=Longispora fulva TaxID=619741 RepID=A0A8J7G8C0_9ACTN|nr:hypothetical protein [Longispora fulva]MBG6134815.1 hypothetical protein [Longispora fulva]GIG56953.1 hypothetical protein Lfu02_13250 [Longispora fulva]
MTTNLTVEGNEFTVTGNHTRPVRAGTVVTFTASMSHGDPDAYFYRWHVEGPFSDSDRQYPGDMVFDWDTDKVRGGLYRIYCVRTPKIREEGEEPPPPADGATDAYEEAFPTKLPPKAPGKGKTPAPEPALKADGPSRSTVWELFVEAGIGSGDRGGAVPVSLQRTALEPTPGQVLWMIIRNRTNAIGFRQYKPWVDKVMCSGPAGDARGPDAYALLKRTTDVFLMHETGVLDSDRAMQSIDEQLSDPQRQLKLRLEEARRLGGTAQLDDIRQYRDNYYESLVDEGVLVLPYLKLIRERLNDIPLKPSKELPYNCYGILKSHITGPLAIELIWSYWHEEGMLAQSLNAIMNRFENRRVAGARDPLVRFDLDPLRPMSNLLWGWTSDEYRRLTVRRRSFEYEHEYGLRLIGRAIPDEQVVDRRSKFIESFHNVLHLAHVFFKEDDDTTVLADGFPLLNALRETHLLLAEGAHNQFGDLPSSARAEMLIMEWLLARPEMREFMGGRIMVPYEEEWMDRVDTMKQMQGWTDVTVTHFRDMGVYGEQILLSIRYGDWSILNDPQEAANWARYWRPELQRYAHAYRAATGVDLTERVNGAMPSALLQRRGGAARRA